MVKILGKRVLLQLDEKKEETTQGGLVLFHSQSTTIATVVAVGDKVEDLKVNDRCIWQKGSRMQTIKYDNVEYYIFNESDICCVVVNENSQI